MIVRRFLIVLAIVAAMSRPALSADVRLTWDPNTETDLAGYKIYFGDASRSYSQHMDVPAGPGEEKTATVDVQPEDGRTVYFAATAYDKAGNESDYSAEVTATIPDKVPPAGVQKFRLIVNLTLKANGDLVAKSARVVKVE